MSSKVVDAIFSFKMNYSLPLPQCLLTTDQLRQLAWNLPHIINFSVSIDVDESNLKKSIHSAICIFSSLLIVMNEIVEKSRKFQTNQWHVFNAIRSSFIIHHNNDRDYQIGSVKSNLFLSNFTQCSMCIEFVTTTVFRW